MTMDAFHAFAREYAVYGYPVLFLGVLLENAGIPVPGETAVLMAGFLASAGHFNLVLVILITVTAAVLGDNIGFWLGHRWARPRLQQGRGFLFLTPRALQLAEGYFQRYGDWTVFFARFITGLRVVGALAAGTAGMPWRRFLLANAAGALAWATTMSLLGYFFGHSFELLHKWIGRSGLIILGCVVVLVGFPFLLRRLRHLPPEFWHRMLRTQVWLGLLAALLEVVVIGLLVLAAEPRPEKIAPGSLRINQRIWDWLGPLPPPGSLSRVPVIFGEYAGTLPAGLLVCGVLGLQIWWRRRSLREIGALFGVLLLSEIAGLILVLLLRQRGLPLEYAFAWPRGFAGLASLRAMAVYGMAAYLIGRQNRYLGHWAKAGAALVIVAVGLATVWSHEQRFVEVMLEYAGGGLALFAGIWWLEGFAGSLRSPGAVADSSHSFGNPARADSSSRGPMNPLP
jgi:membrane-associated protein